MDLRRVKSTPHPGLALHEAPRALSVLPHLLLPTPIALGIATPAPEIWIGYLKHGQRYLDSQLKAPNTEQQLRLLTQYYQRRFTAFDRWVHHLVYCQVPVVKVGEVYIPFTNGHGNLPRLIEFDQLETHQALTTGFVRPETLHDNGQMFHNTDAFDVSAVSATRSVLCVEHALDKKLLVWPLMLTMTLAATVAIVAGHVTRSVATGAEVGGFVGALFALIWAYVMWLFG